MNLSSLLTLHRMQGKKKNSLLLQLLPYHFWQRDNDYDDDDHHSLLLREIHYFLQLLTYRVIDDCLDLASGWDCSSSSSSFEVQGLVILLSSSPSWKSTGTGLLALSFAASSAISISVNKCFLTVHSSLPLTKDTLCILPRRQTAANRQTPACMPSDSIEPSPIIIRRRTDYICET